MTISQSGAAHADGFQALRRLARPKQALEKCELCAAGLAESHRHLLEISNRQILCSCDPCALRFTDVIGGRYKLIPRDARVIPGFSLTEAQWDNLGLPIKLAFFFFSTPAERIVALYPSPAGAMESMVALPEWRNIAAGNDSLREMESDVEAMLVSHVGSSRNYFIVPIDRCFELVGLIRMHWRGLSGGERVWEAIEDFFNQLAASAGLPPVDRKACHA